VKLSVSLVVFMSAAGSASWTAFAHAAKDAGAATGCMGGKFDTSCTGGGKTCGGDVCSWCATAGPGCTSTGKAVACVAANTGDPGWCSTSAECWCSKEDAKCDTKTHHCSFTQADVGAGSSSGSSGGRSSGGDDGGGIDSSTDDAARDYGAHVRNNQRHLPVPKRAALAPGDALGSASKESAPWNALLA